MKRIGSIMLICLLIFVAVSPITNVYAADSLKVQVFNGVTSDSNTIYPNIKLVNNGTSTLTLSSVKLRYYFTNDGIQSNSFACDYSQVGASNVTGTFGTLNTAKADRYLEVGFGSGAGSLPAGSNVEVKLRIWKSDWSNFTQSNDYSFNSTATNFVDSTSVTGYIDGVLTWGTEPGGSVTPTPTTTPTPTITPTPTTTPIVTPTPTVTPSPSSDVLFIGRFDNSDPLGPKFAWGTSTIKANFKGTGISVNLKSSGDNWFNVIIDGVVKTPINVSTSTTSPITLATGLTNDIHTIELVKRTEASIGDVQFLGFSVADGTLLAPPAASARRIEFIGDSITCGYGNEGTSQYQSFTTKNENAYLAYGAVTARLLEADPMTISWSGKGVIRNYGGNTEDLMPQIYSRILPYNSTLKWDSSKWIPQVVVINLCTNDYSTGIPDKTAFTTAYASFVDRIRTQYPSAHIYCAVGPMLANDSLTSARDYINGVVTQKNTGGDLKVHYIEFPTQDQANGLGEDWHPSVKTHSLMAEQLVKQIRTDLGW